MPPISYTHIRPFPSITPALSPSMSSSSPLSSSPSSSPLSPSSVSLSTLASPSSSSQLSSYVSSTVSSESYTFSSVYYKEVPSSRYQGSRCASVTDGQLLVVAANPAPI